MLFKQSPCSLVSNPSNAQLSESPLRNASLPSHIACLPERGAVIGSGMQCTVFDCGEVVEKCVKPKQELIRGILLHKPLTILTPWQLSARADQLKERFDLNLNALLTEDFDLTLVGDVKVGSGRVFQRKVHPFTLAVERFHFTLPRYIEHVFSCWKQGFSDLSFKFLSNAGIDVDGSGAIITLDIGDLTFDKARLRNAIRNQVWRRSSDFRYRLPEHLRAFVADRMSRAFTVKQLDQLWR